LLTFRPEFSTPWTSRAHQTQIALNRLTRSQVSQILTTKAEGGRVASGIIDRIAHRTDGVPLFVEEYSKMLVESTQSLSDTVESWPESTAGGQSGTFSIPTTLQGLLTARLDRVVGDPSVVRLAATLGREFSFELIAAACELPEAQLSSELDKLVDSELLFRRGSPPNSTYLFKHALIQDAAYDSMLRSQRRRAHQQIADALEAKFPETSDQRPELLAHHRTEAAQPREAAPLWEAAGATATDRGAFVEAVQHLQQGMNALESVPPSRQRDQQEYRINVPLGIATLSLKGYAAPELGAIYDRRMELCEKLNDPMGRLHAKWAMGSWRIVRDDIELSLEIGDQIMEMGRAMRDDGALMEAMFIQAIAQFYHADFQESLESCQTGWQLYEPERCLFHTRSTGQHSGVANLCYMALCHWYLGQPASALSRMREGLELAESIDHPFSVAFALHHFGWLNTAMRRGLQAEECSQRQIEVSREQAFFFWETTGMLFRAGGLNWLESYAEAHQSLQLGLARYEATGAKLALPQYLSFLAVAQWKIGDLDAAGASLDAALQAVEESADRFHEPELWRLRGQLAAAQGDRPAAQLHARKAVDLARHYGAVAWELAALLDLTQWTDSGELRDEVIQQIRGVVDRFEPCDEPIPILEQAAGLL
jgi:tetratricopeptide (TPR) repeat protein